MARSIAGFPVEHPLVVLRLRMQGSPLSSQLSVIFQHSSRKNLYSGGFASFGQRVVREAIRWPSIDVINRMWLKTLPPSLPGREVIKNAALGASVAGLESLVLLPIERLIVAKVNEEGYRSFYQKHFRKVGFRSLYSGLSVNIANNFLGWTTFTTMNYWMKFQVNRTSFSKKYPGLSQFAANAGIASTLMLASLPPNFVKTRIQMEPELQKMRLHKVVALLYQRYGVKGFYTGSACTFVQSLFYAYLAGGVMDRIIDSRPLR